MSSSKKTNDPISTAVNWINRATLSLRKADIILSDLFLTFLGIFSACLICTPEAQAILLGFSDLTPFFMAVGGLIGTMLALVLSISIIPIQLAAANFTSSIVHLYREDKVTRRIFFVLAALCLGSFIFSFSEIYGISQTSLVPITIVFIALALDLLRWHHKHITKLIGSNEGIYQITGIAKENIISTQKWISRLSRIKRFYIKRKYGDDFQTVWIEQSYYINRYNKSSILIKWIDEIAEIAHRSVSKQEVGRTQLAISSITEIACTFLKVRKDNLRIHPENMLFGLVSGSDVEDVLSPIYEHFKDVSRSAISLKAETSCLHVVKAFGSIAIALTNLKSPMFSRKRCSFIIYANRLFE